MLEATIQELSSSLTPKTESATFAKWPIMIGSTKYWVMIKCKAGVSSLAAWLVGANMGS
jgi:hypothetical protein